MWYLCKFHIWGNSTFHKIGFRFQWIPHLSNNRENAGSHWNKFLFYEHLFLNNLKNLLLIVRVFGFKKTLQFFHKKEYVVISFRIPLLVWTCFVNITFKDKYNWSAFLLYWSLNIYVGLKNENELLYIKSLIHFFSEYDLLSKK